MSAVEIILGAVCGAVLAISFMKNSCPYECEYCQKRDEHNQSFNFRP